MFTYTTNAYISCKSCTSCVVRQQIVEQHQAISTSNDAVARLMGFATVAQRRKQHARAHMLLANWLAESGQGYHGDILSARHAARNTWTPAAMSSLSTTSAAGADLNFHGKKVTCHCLCAQTTTRRPSALWARRRRSPTSTSPTLWTSS